MFFALFLASAAVGQAAAPPSTDAPPPAPQYTQLVVVALPQPGLEDPLAEPPLVKPAPPPKGPSLEIETPVAAPPRVLFDGNLVLNNEVYAAVLDIPPDEPITAATALEAREKLTQFLHRAGYELAAVEAVAIDGMLLLAIDEGRLDKMILRGQGSLKTVQLKLAVSLPYNVFNRPYLERMLTDAEHNHKVQALSYQLVPTSKVEHFGFQIEDFVDIPTLAGVPIIAPRSAYELHVFLKPRIWNPGLAVNANLSGADGLRLGLDYKGEQALMSNDRYRAGFQIGGKMRSRIVDDSSYWVMSRAIADAQWMANPLGSTNWRPTLQIGSDLVVRQRKDFGIERLFYVRSFGAFAFTWQRTARFVGSFGVGAEHQDVRDVRETPNNPVEIDPSLERLSRWQPMVIGSFEFTFNTEEVRRDRRHTLELTTRQYPNKLRVGFGTTMIKYHKLWELGWHDLVVTSRSSWLWGEVILPEEEPIGGGYVRGVFGEEFYAHEAVNLGMEFRYSISRDLYKLCIFHDGVAFGDLRGAADVRSLGATRGRGQGVRFANSFGVGLHALLADSFQLGLYYARGFVEDDEVKSGYRQDSGLALTLKQAY